MPKYINEENKDSVLWNFYIDKRAKIDFLTKLIETGHFRAQGAAIRALINLYISDKSIQDKINDTIDDFIVYKKNGDMSIN